jgi:hypothetical protein
LAHCCRDSSRSDYCVCGVRYLHNTEGWRALSVAEGLGTNINVTPMIVAITSKAQGLSIQGGEMVIRRRSGCLRVRGGRQAEWGRHAKWSICQIRQTNANSSGRVCAEVVCLCSITSCPDHRMIGTRRLQCILYVTYL